MTERKEIWITKSGEVLDVDEMPEGHVRNTLKMLIKQIREGKLGCLGYHQDRINMERWLLEVPGMELEGGKEYVEMDPSKPYYGLW
jgi:hypothetical protein